MIFTLKALRLATELIPATFAVLGADQVSPFWAVLFYFILILFGIAQQLAIWHCVITGIMAIKAQVLKSWETTITLFSCICGFILGLPMATEVLTKTPIRTLHSGACYSSASSSSTSWTTPWGGFGG